MDLGILAKETVGTYVGTNHSPKSLGYCSMLPVRECSVRMRDPTVTVDRFQRLKTETNNRRRLKTVLAFCFYNLSSIVNGLVYFDQISLLPASHLVLVTVGGRGQLDSLRQPVVVRLFCTVYDAYDDGCSLCHSEPESGPGHNPGTFYLLHNVQYT
jgi:hypothetical protein